MTHQRKHMQTANLDVSQPGPVAWLQAVSIERQQAGAKHRVESALTAPPARVVYPAPAPPAARSPDTAARPAKRAGSEARYVRRWLQPRLPELCEAVLRSALSGDMEATKLLLRMADLEKKQESGKTKKPVPTGPGFAKKAIDAFRSR